MAEKDDTTKKEEVKKPYKRIQYCTLGREGLEFKLGPNKRGGEIADTDEPDPRFKDSQKITNVKDFEFCSGDGSVAVVLKPEGFHAFDTDSGEKLCEVERSGVQRLALSPLGTFVLSWEKHTGGEEGNLILWRTKDGQIVWRAVEKSLLSSTWPTVKFSDDEQVACHMVTNTIHIYTGCDFSKTADKLRYPDVSQFSFIKGPGEVSSENPLRIAVFKPEKKGGPAKISLYNYPGNLEVPVAGKTFFKAQEAEFKWCPTGSAVLCKTETDVDSTGQSYYGESALYLLHSEGQFDCKILPAKEGSFHDFAWSPQGKHFVAISGKSPASSLLYNMKGDPVFDFGIAHRNTIRWSPHGRFLCLGGFGNLSGDMDFWDINKKAKMGSVRANCAVSQEWSPCGRFFMTGTLFPRMRVDNGLTFYTYRGDVLYFVPVRECSKALWRPAAPGVYTDRPQTPLKQLRKQAKKKAEEQGGDSASSTTTPAITPTPAIVKPPPQPAVKQVYRPPGATGSLSALLRREREGGSNPRPLSTGGVIGGVVGGGGVIGGPPVQPMSKSAARRARKKKAKAKANTEGGEDQDEE